MSARCFDENFQNLRTPDDDLYTLTFEEQSQVEDSVDRCYQYFKVKSEGEASLPELERQKHGLFLLKGLQHLSQSYECLDASRPWLCYWILHGLELLDVPIPPALNSQVCQFLAKCQNEEGGFGGGPSQVAHLAPTYAAVNALCILGTEEAMNVINRETLRQFLLRMHQPNGAFIMHETGEEDIRGAYCAASVARITHIMTKAMFDSTPQWIVSCQTYEGGFGGVPGMEAHGGYSFCGLAALVLLNHERLCDIQGLLRWTTQRQMSFEGGFQGRTNKMVDGCYSFWQGGAFPLIHGVLAMIGDNAISAEKWLFNQEALQEYLLICCQHPAGGLIDKPSKPRDYYHTCYCLSGLSVAQHFASGLMGHKVIVGSSKNELKPTHPIYNIGVEAFRMASQYFSSSLVSEIPDKET